METHECHAKLLWEGWDNRQIDGQAACTMSGTIALVNMKLGHWEDCFFKEGKCRVYFRPESKNELSASSLPTIWTDKHHLPLLTKLRQKKNHWTGWYFFKLLLMFLRVTSVLKGSVSVGSLIQEATSTKSGQVRLSWVRKCFTKSRVDLKEGV